MDGWNSAGAGALFGRLVNGVLPNMAPPDTSARSAKVGAGFAHAIKLAQMA
jgi:hypothetical protein